MDKELPKIDLPEDWLAGTDINKELLGLYTNFPVRLKCEVFVLCIEGTVEATLNLNKIQVYPHSLVTLPPGSIFQVNSIEGELKIYILGFSSQYIEENQHSHFLLDTMYHTLGKPVCSLNEKGVQIAESYFKLMIDLYENLPDKAKKEVAFNLYSDIHKGISLLYQSISNERANLSKSEMICRNFGQLVIQHYQNNRNVTRYLARPPLHHREADYRTYVRGNHRVDGHHGCQIAIEVDEPLHPGDFRFTQFRQHVVLRQILQTERRNESVGIQEQGITPARVIHLNRYTHELQAFIIRFSAR